MNYNSDKLPLGQLTSRLVTTKASPTHALGRISETELRINNALEMIHELRSRVESLEKELRGYSASEAESAGPTPR